MPTQLSDLNKAYKLFLKGWGFDQLARELGTHPLIIANAIGSMGDLEWRLFRGVVG